MNKKFVSKLTGAALAIAAAGLAGADSMPGNGGSTAAAKVDLVHCSGVNVCKGHNDCKTANNACAGHASCKGTGYVSIPAKACGDVGGKQQDDWTGSIVKADLVHCSGVNVCKGHNDCKTADNACAGQASCKGTGYVATPAKACTDIGGKVS